MPGAKNEPPPPAVPAAAPQDDALDLDRACHVWAPFLQAADHGPLWNRARLFEVVADRDPAYPLSTLGVGPSRTGDG